MLQCLEIASHRHFPELWAHMEGDRSIGRNSGGSSHSSAAGRRLRALNTMAVCVEPQPRHSHLPFKRRVVASPNGPKPFLLTCNSCLEHLPSLAPLFALAPFPSPTHLSTLTMPSKTSTHKPIATPVDLMREVNNNRHEALQDLWGQYQIGDLDYGPCLPSKSHLELISGDHLQVRFAREEFLNTIGTMEVRNLDSPDCLGMNFMGYDQRTRCLAFRGEARNLDGFLEFANGIVNSEKVEHVFKFASEVQVPEGGLEPGLEYDDFAGRVEIVEYAMLLKEAEDERGNYRANFKRK